MVMKLVERILQEWATVTKAPIPFICLTVLAFGCGYGVSRWKYVSVIESKDQQKEILRERLITKDQQIDEYRERLRLVPAHGSEYAKLSHAELQSETLKFVAGLREWLAAHRAQDSELQSRERVAMLRTTDEAERNQLRDAYTSDFLRSSITQNNEYEAKFKAIAIVLRDELLTRIERPEPNAYARSMYERPNSIAMGDVADDLERLARLLR